MSRGLTLKELRERIHIRLNYNKNRTTNASPFEILFNKNIFTNKKLEIIESNQKIREIVKIQSINNQNINNKKRIRNFKFKIHQKVFKRNFSPDKVEPIWNGPFEIIELDKDENYVIIKEKTKITKQNIKNIRPCFGEGRM